MQSQRIESLGGHIEWSEAPWDSLLFGFPVLQITGLLISGPAFIQLFRQFELARDRLGCRLVSCRLGADRLAESMALEQNGFRYIETTFQPVFELSQALPNHEGASLNVIEGTTETLADVLKIAGAAFQHERFHVDPRLGRAIGDRRYQNWVRSSLRHPNQRLYEIRDGSALVAFFIAEMLADGTAYWHLNAVAPETQGRRYGYRAWIRMLHHAKVEGASRVSSNFVARNVKVMNLYAKLGFRFLPPQMTFHWTRDDFEPTI